MSEEYDELEDSENNEEIEAEWSDIDDEFEPSKFDEEIFEDLDKEFEPLDEKDINDDLDQSDFEPFDPKDKPNMDGDMKDISEDRHTKVTETKELDVKPPDKVPPDEPPKPIVVVPQQQPQPKSKMPPQKPSKSTGNFWDKVEKGLAEFMKGFRNFFKKTDEEINKELLKKQYKKSIYEK